MILGEYSGHACTVELQEKHSDILGFEGETVFLQFSESREKAKDYLHFPIGDRKAELRTKP